MKYENGKIIGVVKSTSKAGKPFGTLQCAIDYDAEMVTKGFHGARAESFFLDENLLAKADVSMIGKQATFSTMWVSNGKEGRNVLCDFNLK